TTVFVQNTQATPISLNITYNFSHDAEAQIADKSQSCTQLTIAANAVATFDPYVQCNLASAYPTATNIFGMMILDDAASPKVNTFYTYSRTAQPVGAAGPNNGFSVEGFPAGNFSSATASAIGLQGSTAAPHFKSNCFIGALGETVNWQLILRDSAGVPIGSSLSGTLGPYQNTRILNVYATALGSLSTTLYDYSNVRATFYNSSGSAMIGYCTVETSDNGSADFRIAKSDDARDVRQSRQACYGMDSCGLTTPSVSNAAYLNSTTSKNIHYAIFAQPDFIQCSLVSDSTQHLGDLEIMLRVPGDAQTALQFVPAAPYNTSPFTAGGPGATNFYVYTGDKNAVNAGQTTRWYIDVSANQSSSTLAADLAATSSNPVPGIPYGITCTSGNGITVPWLGTTGPANP
ncbi:MAG TPA: hypothetical protein VLU54_15410, partial [Casimicrobiaceae bacterium]|nr:hypothetical protein [Casimicrobiaceae bacterium]